ncbi:RNA polymerase sigma factor FliA [Sulfuriflexus sp.]|uniref:RNA polymerase sigma factor FliA n=1 Tax=Sulfuriflexus sp. TaxID=2015443 RepID=UPI0028CE9870|nr:RNA polymerase sigma factor FliA [Sulfuriflexus sp.]MDT8405116.1 RNA polymerase sigma factor FliA [Sulfuriflexus sp.]
MAELPKKPDEVYREIAVDMDAVVVEHASLVKRIAYHLKARLPDSVQVDDLIQAGMIGLIEAGRKYDAGQGARFETYAGIRIRGSMLDELRKNDWAPKSVHRKSRELADAIKLIEGRTGRDARDQEIAAELGINVDEYHRILQDGNACIVSMEQYGIDKEELLPGLIDHHSNPELQLYQSRFREHLKKAIAGLPERERIVISLYYESEMNLREIGSIIGVTESRVSQLLNQAHARLSARLSAWQKDKSQD